MGNLPVDDQSAVFWQLLGKEPEGMTDILNIFEKVQMIGVYV